MGRPIVCNDGITIAKEVELEDPEENLGAQMIREAAERSGEAVGDGTSTAAILTHALFAEGLHNLAAGASAVDLKRGLDRGLRVAVEALKAISRPVASRKEKAQVAAISAHNDAAVGEMVADAYEKVGPEGVITVEESKTTESALDVVEGMQFDRGYILPYFITNGEKVEVDLEDPLILLREKKAAIQGRCSELHKQIEKTTSEYDKEKLQERLAKLAGGVAVIRVGAPSETEMKNRKEALEDAISATKAALAEGIVPGGGLALLRLIDPVQAEESHCSGDERTGLAILRRALEAPTRQIAENSGVDGGVGVDRMRAGKGNYGLDASRCEYVDLVDSMD